jgi:hypothetical protein
VPRGASGSDNVVVVYSISSFVRGGGGEVLEGDIGQGHVQSKPTEHSVPSKIRSSAAPPSYSSVIARTFFAFFSR